MGGGGQLGKMLAQAAATMDISLHVLDPDPNCAAAVVCHSYTKGDFKNYDDLYQFGKKCHILTCEIESVNTEALCKLKSEGVQVYPDPDVLDIIQDKGLQKKFYTKHHFPSPAFTLYKDANEVKEAIKDGTLSYPFVQKARKGGYDGRGVSVIKSPDDLSELLDVPCLCENMVNIEKEIAVIAARNTKGDITCFPAVEMLFNPDANLVEELLCPSTLTEEQQAEATKIASALAEKLNLVGLLAVEFFLDKDGNILINEAAPRPHNSGHHTIEACMTSQYEQHLRAICGFPLGNTTPIAHAVMLNVLGEPGYTGKVKLQGLEELLKIPGCKLHLYGKKETRPFRKMGHITVIGRTKEDVLEKAKLAKSVFKIIA